jgi:toxin ParE1/3/4
MRIEYHPALEAELREIRDYYESCSVGLGEEFVQAFESQAMKISAMPERWMVVGSDIRRALMRRFPYVIFFRVIGTDAVRITVVKHEKRHPSFGMERR